MLHRVMHFLQAILREEHPARFSSPEQAIQQVVREKDTSIEHFIFAVKKKLDQKDMLSAIPVPMKERTTEPYQILMRTKNPAQRYRSLDTLLEQCKRERLNTVNTQLVPRVVYKPVRHLQRMLEQQEES
ncbi:MAG TPA: hypothetical protein VJ761_04985 [Ktedonobacteraceae bacterium]|nr:hypothetical protein [Ktedonobacteraceae bacterium]